tara:strand:+ start:76 stop:435 length:360 start_codon:yes stop_codon:yes gene_type:complete
LTSLSSLEFSEGFLYGRATIGQRSKLIIRLDESDSTLFYIKNGIIVLKELVAHDPVGFIVACSNLHIIWIKHKLALSIALILYVTFSWDLNFFWMGVLLECEEVEFESWETAHVLASTV